MSKDALVVKYENLMPAYEGLEKITEYIKSQEIHSFRDVMNIAAYTGWSLARSNLLRRDIFSKRAHLAADEIAEFKKLTPLAVADLVLEECKWSFCEPHIWAHTQFTKQNAVLKSLHQDIYYE